MPYSEKQRSAAQIALAVKEGKLPRSELKGASLSMYNSMSMEQLKDYAHSKVKKY